MAKLQKTDLLLIALFLSTLDVHALNYYYTGARTRFQPHPQESAPSTAVSETTTVPNATRSEMLKHSATPYTIFHHLTFPQSRGGKNLNLTLLSNSSPAEHVQPRILNRPDLYPHFADPRPILNKIPSTHSPPPQPRFDDVHKNQHANRNPQGNLKNIDPPFAKETDFVLRLGRLMEPPIINKNYSNISNNNLRGPDVANTNSRQPDVANTKFRHPDVANMNFRQPKGARYSRPPQNNKQPDGAPKPQKDVKNPNFVYSVPPQLYQKTEDYGAPPLGHQESAQNWPCFCVPYYLCKNGFINSGGRSVAALKRKTISPADNFKNKTNVPPLVQPKVMTAYVVEPVSESNTCEGNKVCCRLSFEEDIADDNHYPVATPPPDPYYPVPARFPDNRIELKECGIRRAYGVQGRLKQLQYSADVAEFGEYPWQVAILRKVEGEKSLYLCGGVLISPQWLATAAHCILREEFSPLLVRLGEWDVNRKDEVYPYVEKDVDSVVLHPEFNPETLFNDIALIRILSPADPRIPHITPACLPSRGIVYKNEKCWVSGWGKDFFGPQGEYQNVLKEVDVPVMGRSLCNEQLRTTNLGPDFTLHPGFLCAGGEAGKDACTGDGGSPLVCRSGPKWYVVGLVSWGIGCGQPGVPGIYVNMLHYIDWIHSVLWR